MIEVRLFIRGALLAAIAVTFALFAVSGLRFSLGDKAMAVYVAIAGIACAILRPRDRDAEWLRQILACLEAVGLMTVICLTFAVATYPLLSFTSGWRDSYLIAADEMLGFDWLSLWNFVLSHPGIEFLSLVSYKSIAWQPAVVVIYLVLLKHQAHAYRFLAAMIVALTLTDALLVIVPAKSAAIHLLGESYASLPKAGIVHVPIIEGLRSGSIDVVSAQSLHGLITFPSFHVAAAVLFIWAAWPIAWLRVPAAFLNVAMMGSSLVHGGHYFIDLIGGLMVATVAVFTVRLMPCQATAALPGPATGLTLLGTAVRAY